MCDSHKEVKEDRNSNGAGGGRTRGLAGGGGSAGVGEWRVEKGGRTSVAALVDGVTLGRRQRSGVCLQPPLRRHRRRR